MVDTKSVSEATKAYSDAIPRVSANYKAGTAKVTNFEEKAIAGQALYEQKMQDSNVLKRRETGLRGSESSYKQGTQGVGAQRIASGMSENLSKYQEGMQPVIAAINATQLGPRTADPATNVQNRVLPLVLNLAALKK